MLPSSFQYIADELERIEDFQNPSWKRRISNKSARLFGKMLFALLATACWPLSLSRIIRARLAGRDRTSLHVLNFKYLADSVKAPFVWDGLTTPFEQIMILFKVREIWVYEAPGFWGLLGCVRKMELHSKNHVFDCPEQFLSLSSGELRLYCEAHQLTEADKAHVNRLVDWRNSEGFIALLDFFRERWLALQASNPEYVRQTQFEWMPFPRAVEDLALANSRWRCCRCRKRKSTPVKVSRIVHIGEGGSNTLDNAICLCEKCSNSLSLNNNYLLKKRHANLRLKRDQWWKHCALNPKEPMGLAVDGECPPG